MNKNLEQSGESLMKKEAIASQGEDCGGLNCLPTILDTPRWRQP